MANANASATITYTKGKRSYLVISDPLDRLTSTTSVFSVMDAANGLIWTVLSSVLQGKKLRVIIEGTRPPSTTATACDAGDVMITLKDSSGAIPPTVNVLPVDYVEDI